MIHPEAIEATERLYNAWRTGQDVRVTDVINDALDKALKKPRACAGDIAQIVCDHLNISRTLLFKRPNKKKPCREEHVVLARWFIFMLLRDSGISAHRIAKQFDFTHGAVLHGLNRIRSLIASCPEREGRQYNELKQLIRKQP